MTTNLANQTPPPPYSENKDKVTDKNDNTTDKYNYQQPQQLLVSNGYVVNRPKDHSAYLLDNSLSHNGGSATSQDSLWHTKHPSAESTSENLQISQENGYSFAPYPNYVNQEWQDPYGQRTQAHQQYDTYAQQKKHNEEVYIQKRAKSEVGYGVTVGTIKNNKAPSIGAEDSIDGGYGSNPKNRRVIREIVV